MDRAGRCWTSAWCLIAALNPSAVVCATACFASFVAFYTVSLAELWVALEQPAPSSATAAVTAATAASVRLIVALRSPSLARTPDDTGANRGRVSPGEAVGMPLSKTEWRR